jgi:hypothetical protein
VTERENGTRRAPSLSAHLERMGPIDPDAMEYREARRLWRAYRIECGYGGDARILSAPDANVKMAKGAETIYGLSLAPADMSGTWDACQWRTPGCTAVCVLATAGKGPMASVKRARITRTDFAGAYPQAFVTLVVGELREAVAKFGAIGWRPNVASDLRWERFAPAALRVPGVTVYDYTKAPLRHRAGAGYRLTFSVSEREQSVAEALEYLRAGGNAAVVFDTVKGHALPGTWNGFPVIDGDVTDYRPNDPTGAVVGLRAKGSARNGGDATGFVKPGTAS